MAVALQESFGGFGLEYLVFIAIGPPCHCSSLTY